MDVIEVEVNSQQADYREATSLPVSLSIRCDDFEKIATPLGVRLDNSARQMLFPGTRNNQQIIDAITEAVPVSIRVNGTTLFNGTGAPKLKQYSGEVLNGFTLSLNGGATDLFSTLGNKTLRGLEIGSSAFTQVNIENSFTGTYDGGHLAVWAPVYYGDTGGLDNDYDPQDLRPHTYFAAINAAIWSFLRVKVQSTLFDTDFFKRFVYLYGVGDTWAVGNSDAQAMHSQATTVANITAGTPAGKMQFPSEVTDPAGIWATDTGTAAAGVWTFNLSLQGAANTKLTFTIPGIYSQVVTGGGQVTIGPIAIPSTKTFYIETELTDPTQAGQVALGDIKATKQAGPTLGTDVDLATCMHPRKVTEYLAGISHQFNLAWYYDPIRRILHADPRFDFVIGGTRYDGFYKRLAALTGAAPDWTDKVDTQTLNINPPPRPFGDWLDLNNQPEESDWYEQAKGSSSSSVPYLGARYNFSATGQNGKDEINPFWENLILSDDGALTNLDFMPLVLPELDGGDTFPPAPTYESGPKYAYYHGNITGCGSWKYNGAVTATKPVLLQKPIPDNTAGLTVNAGWATHFFVSGTPDKLPGLAEMFYPQWLAILNRGQILDASLLLSVSDVEPSPELFRNPKQITLQQNTDAWIFLGASQFQPLKREPSKVKMAQIVTLRAADQERLVSSTQQNYIYIV